MSINVRTNISQDYGEDIEIVVNTSKYTKEVEEIIKNIQQIANTLESIIGKKGNEISVINIEDVICFYSSEQKASQWFTSYAINILPIALGFEMGSTILLYSMIIGGIIGIAISIDEFSKKRLLITYLGVYTIVLMTLYFIEMEGYAVGYYISSGFEFAIKLFIMYTIIFGISIYSKRLFNKMQSKMLNKELKD